MAADLTAVILTHDEEENLPACLASLEGWVSAILVIDSGSTDQTTAIAQRAGARVVRHPFQSYPAQWDWVLRELPLRTGWILAFDADFRAPPCLRARIEETLPTTPTQVAGYYLDRRLIFRGRWLRWGGCTQPMVKLFRTGRASCDSRETPDIRFYVAGEARNLGTYFWEENQKERNLAFWIAKQGRYVPVAAETERRWRTHYRGWAIPTAFWGTPDQRKLWKKTLWYRMPRYLRPCFYFAYRYLALGGFLDGWQGLLYHSVQGFWLRWQVDRALGRLRGIGASCTVFGR